jgi:hypothetical protein
MSAVLTTHTLRRSLLLKQWAVAAVLLGVLAIALHTTGVTVAVVIVLSWWLIFALAICIVGIQFESGMLVYRILVSKVSIKQSDVASLEFHRFANDPLHPRSPHLNTFVLITVDGRKVFIDSMLWGRSNRRQIFRSLQQWLAEAPLQIDARTKERLAKCGK